MKKSNIVISLILLLLVGIGVLMMIHSIRSLLRVYASSEWPEVPATIESARLKENAGKKKHSAQRWRVEATYQYFVNGREFTGTRVGINYIPSSNREAHQAILDQLKSNDVTARYDPKDPGFSILVPGRPGMSWWFLVFSMIWVGFQILWLVGYNWPSKK